MNQIIGKIKEIGATRSIPSKDGSKTYQMRELILDTTRIDQYTGERGFENYAQFEFSGDKCAELDNYKIGDIVIISFDLRATSYTKDGVTKWFSHVIGYKIEYRKSPQKEATQNIQPAPSQNAPGENLFPPQVDANGKPADSDLPF